MTSLAFNGYGKHRIRVSKIRRPRKAAAKAERHEFFEASVDVELEGDFAEAFTEGDNRNVIATDTCKNTVYVLAKDHPLDTIESFGLAISEHFIGRYDHVSRCLVSLEERVWSRLASSPFCFTASGGATPIAVVDSVRGQSPLVQSGVKRLLIAKTTESGFGNFHCDEYRTLPDTDDRILATELSAVWSYDSAPIDFTQCRTAIVDALLQRFTDHYSRSVQETLYLMGEAALAACTTVIEITLTMPNKHHLLVNLAPFGRTNENEIFVATDEPFGYITGTVARD